MTEDLVLTPPGQPTVRVPGAMIDEAPVVNWAVTHPRPDAVALYFAAPEPSVEAIREGRVREVTAVAAVMMPPGFFLSFVKYLNGVAKDMTGGA
jgi:hypothetical protein